MGVAKKQTKIITALRDRRRVEGAIRSLTRTSGSAGAEREAKRIAGMGVQVIPALTGLLDTSDPRLLGTLGLVATKLDRKEIALALRDVAAWSDRSDRARLAALLILERFLDEEPDDMLYQGLRSPETAVAQSLVEMAEHAAHERDLLCEYVRAIEGQSYDVISMVLDVTFDLGPEGAVLPFWALAQSKRQDVAELVLHRMGSLRSLDSAVMLQALEPTLSPARRALAERSLRKLQLSGVDVPPLNAPHPAWRALISPIDSQGSQSVWFVLDPQEEAPTRVLSVLLNDLVGVWDATHDRNGELGPYLPSECLPGKVHNVVFPGASAALPLLEISFDAGRHLVREALAVNHASETVPPLDYAVLSDALWRWEGPSLDEPFHVERPSAAEVGALRANTADLLRHPAFGMWFAQSEVLLSVARQLGWAALSLERPEQSQLLDGLVRLHFGPEEIARCCRRLERMAEWLSRAGEKETARLSLVAALTLEEGVPENHPLARRMVELGLAVALQDLASVLGQP